MKLPLITSPLKLPQMPFQFGPSSWHSRSSDSHHWNGRFEHRLLLLPKSAFSGTSQDTLFDLPLTLNHRYSRGLYAYFSRTLPSVLPPFAYLPILYAFTKVNVPSVAALREISILFTSIYGVYFLKEKLGLIKVISAALVVVGCIIIRIAAG